MKAGHTEKEIRSMRKSVKKMLLTLSVALTSTAYVSCSTATGAAFRDAAINGAAGVIQETVATLLGDLLSPDGAP